MSKRWWSGLAIAAAVIAATALAAVQSRNAKEGSNGPELTGTWTLDASLSDLPGGPGGRGRFEGTRGRGPGRGWRRGDGDGPGDGTRGPRAEGRLGRRMPRVLHVKESGGVVSFSDSAGALLEVVRTGGAPGQGANPKEVRELTGRWDGGTLIAEWSGSRGGTVVKSYILGENGRTLEVRTERKGTPRGSEVGPNDGGPRRFGRGGFKLVYRRAS